MNEQHPRVDGPDLAIAFLAAFNDIEAHLRAKLSARRSDGFRWMVRLAEKKHLISANQAAALDAFAELRNAISHGPYDNLRPIADPRPDTVATIVQIRDLLLHPPIALERLPHQNVRSLQLGDPIRDALSIIRTTEISQFPVYGDAGYVALLTTNTIARWVAADLQDNSRLDAGTVGEVLDYAESSDTAVFMSRTATAQEVIDTMTGPALPWSVIVTEHGKADQKPLRIISGRDMRALIELVDLK
ncbi:CBS domain-containing protein [Corynebacterium pacaense]|uniref:CBS domain-containing protein n=1 Tax=Corynebacterium pacaense TaxID=1816684 RepID=UPI0009B98363|nr:CBS domain-containing protein [Corynebacterium pacaense]